MWYNTKGTTPMYYLASAFALSMLPGNARMVADRIPDEYVRESPGQYLAERDVYSVVGHQATADMMSALLGIEVVMNREAIQVNLRRLHLRLSGRCSSIRRTHLHGGRDCRDSVYVLGRNGNATSTTVIWR